MAYVLIDDRLVNTTHIYFLNSCSGTQDTHVSVFQYLIEKSGSIATMQIESFCLSTQKTHLKFAET